MTREECIQKFHHTLWGIMLEMGRFRGDCAARSLLEDQLMRKIDTIIGLIWSEFNKVAHENNRPRSPENPTKPAV